MVEAWCSANGSALNFEISAKDSVGVEQSFEHIARRAVMKERFQQMAALRCAQLRMALASAGSTRLGSSSALALLPLDCVERIADYLDTTTVLGIILCESEVENLLSAAQSTLLRVERIVSEEKAPSKCELQ